MSSFVLDWIFENRWAITPEALQSILAIADRDDILTLADKSPAELAVTFHVDANPDDKQVIESIESTKLEGTNNVHVRGGVAIIPIIGPIVPRSSFFARMSGMVSVSTLATDFQVALDNPDIKAILFNIDSPGGVITGIGEFADMMFAAQGTKPVVSYVYGMGASGAYWFASATSEIITAATAETGSIGVVTAYTDFRQAQEKRGIRTMEIVSSVSPKKRPDVFTDEGKKQVQRVVDDLADIFVGTVARNRGTTEDDVRSNFGKGDLLVGTHAVDAGLTDRVGSLEAIITELQGSPQTISLGGTDMSLTLETLRTEHPEVYRAAVQVGKDKVSQEQTDAQKQAIETARTEAADAERKRIQAIEALDAPGYETVITENKYKPEATAASVAALVLAAQKDNRDATAANVKKDGEDLAGKLTGVEAGQGGAETDAAEEKAVADTIAEGGNEDN